MSSKFNLSAEESLKKLGKSLEDIAPAVEEEINGAIADIAFATHAFIISKAQAELNSTRQDYLKGIEFIELGDNSYLIGLNGSWANQLEDGYGPYNMQERLLASKKIVDVGTRAGQPWVQIGKEGQKYAHVPFEKKPFSKAGGASELAQSIQQMTATNMKGRKQKITSIFKDLEGNPLQGKVATARSGNPMLDQLVKYQKSTKNAETGKVSTSSVYMNYRTISELGETWMHPGWSGLHALDEAEKYAEEQIDKIVNIILGGG